VARSFVLQPVLVFFHYVGGLLGEFQFAVQVLDAPLRIGQGFGIHPAYEIGHGTFKVRDQDVLSGLCPVKAPKGLEAALLQKCRS
jgi:hypothetical protein